MNTASNRILGIRLFAATLLVAPASAQTITADSLVGEYVRDNRENEWHEVEIEHAADGSLVWKNAADREWGLEVREDGVYSAAESPYGEQKLGIETKARKLVTLQFNNEIYRRMPKHHWKYGDEENWPSFGDPRIQSPIEVAPKGGEGKLPGSYASSPVEKVINNGHAFQLDYGKAGGGTLESGSRNFTLAQFHFHSPSEHTQTGYAGWTDEEGTRHPGHYAMEVHFVHTDGSFGGDGDAAPQRRDLAVVGVFIMEGAENAELAKLWAECPEEEGADTDLAFAGFDASKLMPTGGNYQTYEGSLTTPPLSSGVSWFVMDEPIEASKEQIEKLREAMKRDTNRSIQGSLRERLGGQ